MTGHPRAELVAARDDVEDSGRNDVAQDLAEHQRRDRRVRRGLQHDGVAREQGRRDLPHPEHQRVIPRRDRGDDAERLALDFDFALRRVLQHLAGQIEHRGVCAPHRGAHDFLARLVQRLALLERERARQPFGRLLQCSGAFLEDFAARVDVFAPGGKRLLSGGHRLIEFGLGAIGNFGEDLSGGGIDHASGFRSLHRLAVDSHGVSGPCESPYMRECVRANLIDSLQRRSHRAQTAGAPVRQPAISSFSPATFSAFRFAPFRS